MAIFTTGAFASVNKEKSVNTKITKKAVKSKVVECNAYQIKIPFNAGCDYSWYNVASVDTISVTCDANGQPHSEIWHWEEDPALLCSGRKY